MMAKGLPIKLHQLAVYCLGSADGERNGHKSKMMVDVIFLAGYFGNRCIEFVRGAFNAIAGSLLLVRRDADLLRFLQPYL